MTRYSHGRPYYIYEAGARRNEPLDIRVYALAAHRRVNFDSVGIKAEMAAIQKECPTVKESLPVASEPITEKLVGNIVVERAPIHTGTRLPAYIPISQRGRAGTGESIFQK